MIRLTFIVLCCLFLGGCYVVERPVYSGAVPAYYNVEAVQYAEQQREIQELQRWKHRQQVQGWVRGEYLGNFD